ncbi:DUF4240 domain-containing protein [Streptomyces sp. NBC_01190]|uniref:DUF4240 domain-containing protein n=1 Tax=Streptomyces sp. NBC_01190 TaxID=2903767 RepID=UPI003869319D|nr:DUF4240 domain-containing protein [Streptomyces sp. NBC_01190]
MGTDDFWHLVETARSRMTAAGGFDRALVELLAAGSQREVLGYHERFEELLGALYRWDVWAAAYLIGGGCSDDGFTDFRAGVIAEGRAWYERVAADPDSLAGHPSVAAAAARVGGAGGGGGDRVLFSEEVNYAAAQAFERLTGDEDDFYEAWDQYSWETGPDENGDNPEKGSGAEMDMGEDFQFADPDQMHRRLPRLAALYLPRGRQADPCFGGASAPRVTCPSGPASGSRSSPRCRCAESPPVP